MLTARYGLLLISSLPYHIKKPHLHWPRTMVVSRKKKKISSQRPHPAIIICIRLRSVCMASWRLLALTKHYMRRPAALDCRRFLAATTLSLCVAGFYGNTYTNTAQAGKGAYFHYKRPHKMCIEL